MCRYVSKLLYDRYDTFVCESTIAQDSGQRSERVMEYGDNGGTMEVDDLVNCMYNAPNVFSLREYSLCQHYTTQLHIHIYIGTTMQVA